MEIKTSELNKLMSVAKYFGQRSALDNMINYVFFYKDKVLARNFYAGVIFFHNIEIVTEFGISCDILNTLLPLMEKYESINVVIENNEVVWKFGKTKYKTALLQPPEFETPLMDTDNLIPLSDNFLESLAEAEFAISQDVRQINLYGIYINKEMIGASDNARAYYSRLVDFKDFEDVFITKEMVNLLTKLKIQPLAFQKHNNKLFFAYENFYIYSAEFAVSYPKLDQVFKEQTSDDKLIVKVKKCNGGSKKIKDLLNIVQGDQFITACEVTVTKSELVFVAKSNMKGEEFETVFSAEVDYEGEDVVFKVSGRFFLEALLRWNTFKVFEYCILFGLDTTKYIVMKMSS